MPSTGPRNVSSRSRTDWFDLNGEAEVDRFPDYLNNLGL